MTEIARRSRLFLGSYALLFLMLALRFRSTSLEVACATLALIGIADMVWIVYGVSARTAPEPLQITSVVDAGPEVAGYLATYLLPFLTVSEPTGRDIAAYALFFAVTGLVYVRSEMAQINPTLYLLGRRVVHVGSHQGWEGHVVVQSSVRAGDVIRVVPLNADVRVEVRRKAALA